MNDLETEITLHNNDVIMKAMAETFKDKTLRLFGLNTAKIIGVIPTILPVLEVKENRIDYIFLLEDNTLLHLEFQTTVNLENLKRFLLYDARLINKDNRNVNTAVVYSGRIKIAPDQLKKGSIVYQVINVYMKDYDGDAEYKRLNDKILKHEELDEEDILKLIFLPLMKSKQTEEEMAIRAAELAKEVEGEIKKTFIIGTIIAVTDKFMSEDYKKKLLEVLRMTQIEQWIREEGREEGIKKGREEGIKEGKMETAKAALAKGFSIEDVIEITGLTKEVVRKLKNEMN
nr:Rpn family recombination-promoting nuclease/putative transposase [Desulfofarcimen acetoxidans]